MVLLGLGPGDEVVVPSLSFIATANAAKYVGATPVFADVDLETQNITAETIEDVLSPATRAVILVHQVGAPADVDSIRELTARRGIALVEDAACAIGSTYKGGVVGGNADLATFSFHPRKLLTTGEGGMLTSASVEEAVRARRLREHGMSVSASDRHRSGTAKIESYLETGYNYRMTDIQAAIGLVQLGRLEELLVRRRAQAARGHRVVCGSGCRRGIRSSLWNHEFSVLLDAAARRRPHRARRTVAMPAGRWHLRQARSHGEPPGASVPQREGASFAGHGDAHRPDVGPPLVS